MRRPMNALRVALGLLFVASAIAKLVDFAGTAAVMERALGTDTPAAARAVLGGLVLGEAGLGAVMLVALSERARLAADAACLSACLALLTAAVWLWWRGAADCGCFGTLLAISPAWTVAKNVLLTGAAATLCWRARPEGRAL
jgi:hypothetical protein